MISAMHLKWPSKCILMGETDLDAAYQKIHANLHIVSTCTEIVGKLYFLCLYMTFGTMSSQEEYNTIIEAAIEIGNDILMEISWEAKDLKSPYRHLF